MKTVPYVLPLPTPASGGPLAAWVGAWGVAVTGRRFGLEVVVISPQGTFRVEQLQPILAAEKGAASTGPAPVQDGRRRRVAKDLRQWLEQQRFARLAVREVRKLHDVPFVLTRHVLFGVAGAHCAAALQVPLVSWIHAALVQEATSWGTRRLAAHRVEQLGERRPLAKADLWVGVTQNVLDDLGLHGPRAIVNGNGTLLERFDGSGPREPRIVWVGSFRGFHGLETIVGAFEGLDAKLVLVGRGSQQPTIEADVRRRGLEQDVELPGFVAPLELPAVLARCQIGVVASGVALEEFHYSPVKLREYAAAGLVVCLPAVGEMAALAQEPWVVPHDNTTEGLHRAMATALERAADPAVVASARAYAERNYSWVPWWAKVLTALGEPHATLDTPAG